MHDVDRDLSHVKVRAVDRCWCGSRQFFAFNEQYQICEACGTLVCRMQPSGDLKEVYEKDYWEEYQSGVLGQPTLIERARTDLPERCVYWLRALMKYKLPPAKVLEVGAGHGGFVALMSQAGYDASGIELSPFAVKVAREKFDVELMQGPLKAGEGRAGELDAILLFDVVEHLPDPVASVRDYRRLLKPDGVLMVQTPEYVRGTSYETMSAGGAAFLHQLMPLEHLHLFTRESIRALLDRAGFPHVEFERALFSIYDMFLVASPSEINAVPDETIVAALNRPGAPRFIQALLDLYAKAESLTAERLELYQLLHARNAELIALNSDRLRLEQALASSEAELGQLKKGLLFFGKYSD